MNRRSLGTLLIAAVSGACTMAIELAAVRLLAPWFGTSTSVWTNVIGVVLLALSIGYLLGAKLSKHENPARPLGLALAFSAACAAWLPATCALVARGFLPSGLSLDEAGELVQWGSLASALILFAPSTLALGCVAPLCAEILEREARASAGRAGGAVLCASTLGSLAGTFGTTYVAVPRWGLTATFLVAGVSLALLAVSAWWSGRTRSPLGAALVIPFVLALCCARAARPDAPVGMRLLAARESTYQSVRIVESGNGAERLRFLQVNESFDSFQSVWQEKPGFLPDGYYYNFFALPVWWARGHVGPWRLVVLGLGAGTAWRVIDGAKPPELAVESVGIEIDPVVVELARTWLDLPGAERRDRTVHVGQDARAGLRELEPGLDQIVLDAYANQVEMPAHLVTLEFFREARSKLGPGGWLSANVGAFGLDDPVLVAVAGTLAAAFERRVLALRVPFSRNVALYARRDADPPEPGSRGWLTGEGDVDRRLSAVSLPGTWRWFEPATQVALTDDRSPIEELQRRSIVEAGRRARGEP